MALHPDVTPRQLVPIPVQLVGKEEEQPEIQNTAYGTPCHIGNKQTLDLILQEEPRRCRNALVEIAGFEKKETDKKECPCHQFVEPQRTSPETAHTNTMQDNHPKNAKSAEQVKSVISLFHGAKIQKKRLIGITMNYELWIMN